MARVRKALNVVTHWDQVVDGVANNRSDLSDLEKKSLELKDASTEVRDLHTEQSALTARKQEVSKRLKSTLRRGEGLADFLRTGVRQVYGYGSEKLVEFGMQPLRPRSRPGVSEPATPPSPETPDPADSKATDEAGE